MILLKTLLAEAKLYAYSTAELLEKVLKFDGKTLVFLDTETAGLEPNVGYAQITQLSAMAYDGSSMKLLGEYSRKISISPRLHRLLTDPESWEAKSWEKMSQRHLVKYHKQEKHPSELLQMTGYHTTKAEEQNEKDALLEVEKFIDQFPNVILIIHNATFDMKVLQARRKKNHLPFMKRYPVLDTLKIARFFLIPTLVSMENVPEIKAMLEQLLAKTKYKSYASSLGRLAHVFGVTIEKWHEAQEDVKILFELLQKIVEFLKKNTTDTVGKQQRMAGKRYRKM